MCIKNFVAHQRNVPIVFARLWSELNKIFVPGRNQGRSDSCLPIATE